METKLADVDLRRSSTVATVGLKTPSAIERWYLSRFVPQASPIGVLGHARMSVSPIVIVDSDTAHQSTSSQPCLAEVGRVQEASCFSSGMLSRLSYDPTVPCLGNPPLTVESSDAARDRTRTRRLEL